MPGLVPGIHVFRLGEISRGCGEAISITTERNGRTVMARVAVVTGGTARNW